MDDSFRRHIADPVTFWISGNHTVMIYTCSAAQTDRRFIFDIVFQQLHGMIFSYEAQTFPGRTGTQVGLLQQLEMSIKTGTLLMVRDILKKCVFAHYVS